MQTGAREAALETLMRCRRDGAWSGASIDAGIKKYELSRRDAALASRLCLGVIQNSSLCDYYIGCCCSAKLEPKVRDILRMGVYQLLFLDRIPARAAVSEAVALCKSQGCARAAGLVNAVLRRIADNINSLPLIPGEGTAGYLSIKYSHPAWLVQYLIDRKGYDFTEAFLRCCNSPAPLSIQVNTLKVSAADYARALARAELEYERCDAPEGCITLPGGSATELPGFDEGLFYVQDRAARMAVEIAAPKAGMRVLDACSCPGGKSFAAAIAMENCGSILSCDIHEKKLRLVRDGAQRLGIDIIETAAMDAREFKAELAESFDIVIADVPCSGFGVIAKKPEIRSKTPESIAELPKIQGEILDNVSKYVCPGGVLLYSTCTVTVEENENTVKAFLERNGEYTVEPFEVCGVSAPDGMYTFWPNVDGTDGFFAAKLRRRQ